MLVSYMEKHRPTPAPGSEQFVFLTPQGRQVAHLSDDLRALSKDFPTSMGVLKLTATNMRKLSATGVAAEGTEDMVRKVAAHMTHGEDTTRKYYRHLQGVAESVNAYTEVTAVERRKRTNETTDKDEELVPKLKKRKFWSKEEEKEIKKAFDISAKTPTLEDCGAFLKDCNQELFKVEHQRNFRTNVEQLRDKHNK